MGMAQSGIAERVMIYIYIHIYVHGGWVGWWVGGWVGGCGGGKAVSLGAVLKSGTNLYGNSEMTSKWVLASLIHRP